MGKYSDQILSPKPSPQKNKWSDMYLSPQIQREFSPTEEIDTRTGQPRKVFTPTGEKSTSFGALVKSGFVDDPQTKINIFAKSRGISPDRYRVVDGEIVYRGDDGRWYTETKQTPAGKLKRFAGETVANAPSIVMGTVGAAGGPVTAGIGAAGGEGIRKSVGSLVFDEPQTSSGNIVDMATAGALGAGSEVLLGRGSTNVINRAGRSRGGKLIKAAGRSAADIDIAGTKELERLGTAHKITLYPPQTTGNKRLIDKFNLLGDIDASSDIIQRARTKQAAEVEKAVYKFFKDLSPSKETTGETGGKLVTASQKALQEPVNIRRSKAAPIYKKAFEGQIKTDRDQLLRTLKINNDTIKRLESVKAVPDIDKMVSALKERGVPTMAMAKEGRQAYSDRILADYNRIIKKEIPMSGGIKDIEEINRLKTINTNIEKAIEGKPPAGFNMPYQKNKIDTSDAIKEINSLMSKTIPKDPSYTVLKRIRGMIEDSSGDLEKLHRVKTRGIDAVLNKAQSDSVLRREMKIVKNQLVDAMDKASPDYAKARKIFSDYSEEITKQSRKTILGDISKLEGDKVTGAVKKLFASPEVKKSPEIITRIRSAITKQDPKVWNKAIVDHLQGLFEATKESATGGITNKGGHFYKKVWGDIGQRKVLEAAMDKTQFKALSDFMKVLERTGMILGKESATATRQLALEEMKRAGQSKFIMASTRPLYTYQRIIGDYLNEVMMGKSSKQLAEVMVSKKAAEQLNRMVQLGPNREKLVRQFATFLGLTGGGGIKRKVGKLVTKDTENP